MTDENKNKTKVVLGMRWILCHCPLTNELVVGQIDDIYLMPEKQAAWWFCPACQGWHVVALNDISNRPLSRAEKMKGKSS